MSLSSTNRIVDNFIKLTKYDSEFFHEGAIANDIISRLTSLGVAVRTDTTDERYLKEHPSSHPNIYGFLPGNRDGEPILFSAHLDTVASGNGKRAQVTADGKIISDGTTVLGADDISGIVSILEALERIQEGNLEHPDIEILITVAEEPFCEGSKYFDFGILKSQKAYVFDLTGPVGRAAIAAPSISSFEIEVRGKAAHAGFAPEEGINALSIAVESLKELKTGRIEEDLTVNFGTIVGGTGNNIVPEYIRVTGEIRSLDHQKVLDEMERIFQKFDENARKAGGIAFCSRNDHMKAYRIDETAAVVNRFRKAAEQLGYAETTELITTYGGSDGNRLNEHGIPTIVLACAMENVHTTGEYTVISELEKSAELALKLMILK